MLAFRTDYANPMKPNQRRFLLQNVTLSEAVVSSWIPYIHPMRNRAGPNYSDAATAIKSIPRGLWQKIYYAPHHGDSEF